MLCFSLILLFIIIYTICDVNYFVRTLFTVLSGRVLKEKRSLNDVTTIYGMGTFQDCDIHFKHVRLARLVRELDFARYHFYDTTGIYHRSQKLGIKSLQGCTLTVTMDSLPIFVWYKINTKLVYWDEKSLFLEHEVITLDDNKCRCFLISRQHAIGELGDSTKALLIGLPGSEVRPECPQIIRQWLDSMVISSAKLKRVSDQKNSIDLIK